MAALTHMQRRSAWASADGVEAGVTYTKRGAVSQKIWSLPPPQGLPDDDNGFSDEDNSDGEFSCDDATDDDSVSPCSTNFLNFKAFFKIITLKQLVSIVIALDVV